MYRAVPKESYVGRDVPIFYGMKTSRLPSNVPYFIDNLIEYLRPGLMPSRRRAIYASPTPELALQNASAGAVSRDDYVVCEVIVDPQHVKIAQLAVSDARHHSDIRLMTRYINSIQMSDAERAEIALIFTPGATVAMLDSLGRSKVAKDILDFARSSMTFWSDASVTPEDTEGELFFELNEGASYILNPVGF